MIDVLIYQIIFNVFFIQNNIQKICVKFSPQSFIFTRCFWVDKELRIKQHFKLKISFDEKVSVSPCNTENNFCVKTVLISRYLNMEIKNHGGTKSFYNSINRKK